jgi:DNA-binding NarL/FixJ family response regulator
MDPGKRIRILTVEDHPVFRAGLTTIIASEPDMLLVGQATNAAEAIAEFRRHRPDITLMNLRLPGANGTDTLITIRGEYPDARIIMLTTADGDVDIQRAMRAGARGYILKSMPQEELLEVVRSVHAGRRHVPPGVAARLAEHLGKEDLTTRELEVLQLIREGYRNKQIADQLAIAETTVSFHIKNLVDKLEANERMGWGVCGLDTAEGPLSLWLGLRSSESLRMKTPWLGVMKQLMVATNMCGSEASSGSHSLTDSISGRCSLKMCQILEEFQELRRHPMAACGCARTAE